MDASPLAKLPPELRNNIFGLVLLTPTGINIEMLSGPYNLPELFPCDTTHARDYLALMATCTQIRTECLPTFFGANEFTVDFWTLAEMRGEKAWTQMIKSKAYLLRGWLQSLGSGAEYLRHLSIYAGIYDALFLDNSSSPVKTSWTVKEFTNVIRSTSVVKTTFIYEAYFEWRGDSELPATIHLSPPYGEQEQQSVLRALPHMHQEDEATEEDEEFLKTRDRNLAKCQDDVRRLFECLRRGRTQA